VFFNKDKIGYKILKILKHQIFWNKVEVLKHQKKRNGGCSLIKRGKIKDLFEILN